jgi:hypothetical protein
MHFIYKFNSYSFIIPFHIRWLTLSNFFHEVLICFGSKLTKAFFKDTWLSNKDLGRARYRGLYLIHHFVFKLYIIIIK